jgi:hypothetical protein
LYNKKNSRLSYFLVGIYKNFPSSAVRARKETDFPVFYETDAAVLLEKKIIFEAALKIGITLTA